MSQTISKTFSAAGQSNVLVVPRNTPVTLNMSGTYAASAQLERARTMDQSTWDLVAGPYSTANATVATGIMSPDGPEQFVAYRVNCTSYTSGSLVTSMVSTDKQVMAQTDPDGDLLESGTVTNRTVNSNLIVLGTLSSQGPGNAPKLAGAAITLTAADNGRTILLNTLAGSFVTLPAAIGSGVKYRFVVSVVNTSVNHSIKTLPTTDVFAGKATTEDSATTTGYVTASNTNTILLNGTTTGGLTIGDCIDVEDIASGVWVVQAQTSSSGSAATPFSHV